MTTTETVTVESPIVVEKVRKPRAKMEQIRKDEHLGAKEGLLKLFEKNPDIKAKWTSLPIFADKQVRVISNVLLDYIPGFVSFINDATPEQIAQCDALLTSINDLTAYRKANVPIWKASN